MKIKFDENATEFGILQNGEPDKIFNKVLIQHIKAMLNFRISVLGSERLSEVLRLLGINNYDYTVDYKITNDNVITFTEQKDGSYIIDIDIPDQPEVPKWIPVKERLPEEDKDYLVTGKWGGLEIATYIKATNQWVIGYYNKDIPKEIGVIAWMPLPEPYKEV